MMRYQNWPAASGLHHDISRLFRTDDERQTLGNWTPAVDIREEGDCFVVHADVPGVDPGDIEITLEDGVLNISGTREEHRSDNTDGYSRIERVSGRFFRRFTLPDGVDAEQVRARSDKGVLEITIPKQAQAQRRRINVNAS